MKPAEHTNPDLDRPATYQIKVRGHLDDRWSDWFGGMTIAVEHKGDGPSTTILTGTVADQAALQGMLRALYTLGLPVCSVTCVESGDAPRPDSEQGQAD